MSHAPVDLPLACRCGRIRGLAFGVAPKSTGHVICYCDDCQAFARFVGVEGVMDERGGTDVFQLPPARVRITEGHDALACLRLSEKGLFRFYASCCKTPIANTAGGKIPFVGIIHSFATGDPGGALAEPDRIFGRFAVGGCPAGAPPRAHLSVLPKYAVKILGWWIAGQRTPSPFFDATTGAPRAVPRILTAAERAAFRAASERT